MPWIFLFLFLVPVYGQTVATTEDGGQVMLFQDGTWRAIEEKKNEMVYVEVTCGQTGRRVGVWGGAVRDAYGAETVRR